MVSSTNPSNNVIFTDWAIAWLLPLYHYRYYEVHIIFTDLMIKQQNHHADSSVLPWLMGICVVIMKFFRFHIFRGWKKKDVHSIKKGRNYNRDYPINSSKPSGLSMSNIDPRQDGEHVSRYWRMRRRARDFRLWRANTRGHRGTWQSAASNAKVGDARPER